VNQASVWSVLNRSHAFHLSLRRSIFDVTLMKNDPPIGAVAQLGERSVRNAEVEGSIPFRSTDGALPRARLLCPYGAKQLSTGRSSVRCCAVIRRRQGELLHGWPRCTQRPFDRFLGGSSTVAVFHGCLIHCDGSFHHQVHRLLRWEQREPFESHIRDHFKDGFLDPLLQLADGLHPAPHGKASEVRVARQGLPPLSGLITSRRCVTLSAVTA
jgi:hypothetical protein